MAGQDRRKDQPGTRTTRTPPPVPPTDSGAGAAESQDPQLRKVHEQSGSDDEQGRGNDVPVEQGGARHRQQ